jgi:hypothetical protein
VKPRPKVPAPLFPLPPADEATLTPRQKVALRILRQSDGLTGYVLGRHVHDYYGTHLDGRRDCEHCSRTGVDLAKTLKSKGLVKQRSGGVYVAARASGEARGHVDPGAYDPATAPWPDGFGDAA